MTGQGNLTELSTSETRAGHTPKPGHMPKPAHKLGPPTSREKILDVAETLFARRGMAGVGMREVADRVGLGKSSLFHHFRSKDHLYLEVLGRVLSRIRARVEPRVGRVGGTGGRGDAVERMDLWLDALVNALVEYPTTARLLLRALFEDYEFPDAVSGEVAAVDETLMSILAGFRQLVGEGIEAGAYRSVDIGDATQTMIGAIVYHFASGELGESITGGPLFAAKAVARRKGEVKEFLIGGLATRAANYSAQVKR